MVLKLKYIKTMIGYGKIKYFWKDLLSVKPIDFSNYKELNPSLVFKGKNIFGYIPYQKKSNLMRAL